MTRETIPTKNRYLLLIVVSIIIIAADQITKYFVVEKTSSLTVSPYVVIPGFADFVSVRNTGAAWGMFSGNGLFLFIIAVIVFILLIIFFKSITEGYFERALGIFMVFSGIIGNSLDRIFRGSVVDFIDLHIHNFYHWPAFNIADSSICIGVIIIIISSLLRKSQIHSNKIKE